MIPSSFIDEEAELQGHPMPKKYGSAGWVIAFIVACSAIGPGAYLTAQGRYLAGLGLIALGAVFGVCGILLAKR